MFKALHALTGEEIVILDPHWRKEITKLRELARDDRLVCQGCRQPVRVRVPRRRRPHFAHKHLHNCALSQASPELLQARALLYEWLATQFGTGEPGRAITLEKTDAASGGSESNLPRPVDGWVDLGERSFAYWILETRLHPEVRKRLLDWAENSAAHIQWVFLNSLLHEDQDQPGKLFLTTTERAFLSSSVYGDSSLHYLDSETGILTSFRGLQPVHSPQGFTGRREQTALHMVVASAQTGEFVHPGESVRLRRRREGQAARERRVAERLTLFEEIQRKRANRDT